MPDLLCPTGPLVDVDGTKPPDATLRVDTGSVPGSTPVPSANASWGGAGRRDLSTCTPYESRVAVSGFTNDGTSHLCPDGMTTDGKCTAPCYDASTLCTTIACEPGEECVFYSQGAHQMSDGPWVSDGWQAKCVLCGAGHYGGGGDKSCTACPEGKYTRYIDRVGPKVTRVDQCFPCAYGTVAGSGNPKWDECWPCGTGKYQPDNGKSLCLECEAGTYMPGTQAGNCLSCEDGKYMPGTGASSCLPCDGNTDAAKTTCTPPVPELLGGLFGLQGQECGVGECPGYLQRINQCLCATCCPEVHNQCHPRFAHMTANCR